MVRKAQEEQAAASPTETKPPETPSPDAGNTPLRPSQQPGAEIFGPPQPGKSDVGNVEPRSAVEQTGALEPKASEDSAVSVVKPQPPKPKPKRQPAKTKVDPGAPLVLVPPQKIAKPTRKREPDFFERLFGKIKSQLD